MNTDKTISIGFSPCPNDTFIFDALIHGKIDTHGFKFLPILYDVENLNQKAFRTELNVTNLSFHAYSQFRNNYYLLPSGSALSSGVGPFIN